MRAVSKFVLITIASFVECHRPQGVCFGCTTSLWLFLPDQTCKTTNSFLKIKFQTIVLFAHPMASYAVFFKSCFKLAFGGTLLPKTVVIASIWLTFHRPHFQQNSFYFYVQEWFTKSARSRNPRL